MLLEVSTRDLGVQMMYVVTIRSGIGLVMARALEANGATVFILDMNSTKLEEARKQAVNLRPDC